MGKLREPSFKNNTSGVLLRSTSGVTIMEVVVVAAIGSIIMLAMATMFGELFKNQSRLQHQTEAFNMAENVRSLLSDANACKANFNALPVVASVHTPADLKRLDSTKAFEKDKIYENNKVLLQNMELTKFIPDSTSGLNGRVDLRLDLLNPAQPTVLVSRFVGLRAQVNGAGQLTGCFAINVRKDNDWTVWQHTTSTEDVYFAQGKVGIGNSSPAASLDVTGEIKPGNTGLDCTSAIPGAIRQNAGLLEYCNTAVSPARWVAIGAPEQMCGYMGGTWNGSACTFPLPPDQLCTIAGNTWNGTSCTVPAPPVASHPTPVVPAPTGPGDPPTAPTTTWHTGAVGSPGGNCDDSTFLGGPCSIPGRYCINGGQGTRAGGQAPA